MWPTRALTPPTGDANFDGECALSAPSTVSTACDVNNWSTRTDVDKEFREGPHADADCDTNPTQVHVACEAWCFDEPNHLGRYRTPSDSRRESTRR